MRVRLSTRLRIDDRQARAPLQVSDQRGAEFGIVGHARCVRRFQQQRDPTPAHVVRQMTIEVVLDHVRMAAVMLRVCCRPSQHLRQKRRHVARVVRTHVRKHRREQCVLCDMLIKARSQLIQLRRFRPAIDKE